MIRCKECGTVNDDAAGFCGGCGQFLEWTGERIDGDAPSPAETAQAPTGSDGPHPIRLSRRRPHGSRLRPSAQRRLSESRLRPSAQRRLNGSPPRLRLQRRPNGSRLRQSVRRRLSESKPSA